MKRWLWLCPLFLVLTGCANNDDGIDHSAVQSAQAPLKAAAQRTGGDWSKLSPEEQKLFLDRARGNEKSAKMIFSMFASGPPAAPPRH
ncbi:MAG: hypothetical protein P4L46_11770 [Fimbriimonas sp.]|nr:hypothetical protein [Fimbriimonas sp.]